MFKKIIIENPEYVEGIHDEIPYLLPFGSRLVATDEDGKKYESTDAIIWTEITNV